MRPGIYCVRGWLLVAGLVVYATVLDVGRYLA
jgi:hypothetical protein